MGTRQEIGIFVLLLLLAAAGLPTSSPAAAPAAETGAGQVRVGQKTGAPCQAGPENISARQRLLLGLRIPIASATADDLTVISGIGPHLAAEIVAARTAGHGFESLDDLMQVKGIGAKRLAAIRVFLCLTQ